MDHVRALMGRLWLQIVWFGRSDVLLVWLKSVIPSWKKGSAIPALTHLMHSSAFSNAVLSSVMKPPLNLFSLSFVGFFKQTFILCWLYEAVWVAFQSCFISFFFKSCQIPLIVKTMSVTRLLSIQSPWHKTNTRSVLTGCFSAACFHGHARITLILCQLPFKELNN